MLKISKLICGLEKSKRENKGAVVDCTDNSDWITISVNSNDTVDVSTCEKDYRFSSLFKAMGFLNRKYENLEVVL